ncbi:MAG: hypothetical protein HY753_02725 [Nitrospirae bacterium]|nr:hypothetical protein [Nitrospirota bacterium]
MNQQGAEKIIAQLTYRSIQKLQDSIRTIYSNLDKGTFASHILSAVSNVIPSTIASYNEVRPYEKQRPKLIVTPSSAVNHNLVSTFNQYMYEHPYINFLYPKTMQSNPFRKRIEKFRQAQKIDYNHFPKSRALKISDMLTQSQFHNSALYNEYYKKLDTEYQMVMPLLYDRNLLSGFAFNRDMRDFTQEERLILNFLAPHVIQAHKNAAVFSKIRDDKTGVGKMLLDGKAKDLSPETMRAMGITLREAEILHWISQGKTNAEISAILNISLNTVKTHQQHIYEKIGVENRVAAARFVMEKGEGI